MPSNLVSTSSSKLDLFLKGIVTPIRAVGVIFSSPKLIGLCALPIGMTVIMLSLVFYALMAGMWTWMSSNFTGYFANYQSSLMVVAGVIAGVIFIYIAIQSLAILTSLFASPFNDALAENTERTIGVPNVPSLSVGRLVRVFFLDLRKTVVSLTLSILMAVILLIPVVGIVAFLGIALLNTFTFVTYPQSRREMSVRDSARWIRAHLPSSLGFGLTSALMFSIPVINLFALPVCVVGGTLLYVEMERAASSRTSPHE